MDGHRLVEDGGGRGAGDGTMPAYIRRTDDPQSTAATIEPSPLLSGQHSPLLHIDAAPVVPRVSQVKYWVAIQ